MWKIVVVLLATAVFILLARFAYDPPVIQTRVGLSALIAPFSAPFAAKRLAPPLMYAGVRG